MPLSPAVVRWLAARGHDAVHASQVGLERATDVEILKRARDGGRVVVTADLDYPRLLALSGEEGPGVILFRGGNYGEQEVVERLATALAIIPEVELPRCFVVIEKTRIRRRYLPLNAG